MKSDIIKNSFKRALIIDDELDICLMLGMLLKKYGIASVKAHTLADAYDKLNTEEPELIFLDNNLPDGTGLDNIQKIKFKMPNAKLVMITAMSALHERALALGANGFVEKPLDLKKIEQILA